MKRASRLVALTLLALLCVAARARAEELPEYRIKAAFVYNFALFTEWPAEIGSPLNLCILGTDPFGKEIDVLQGKPVGGRSIAVLRKAVGEPLNGCQMVFIARSAIGTLQRVLEELHGRPVLTIADSAGAARQGAALNLAVDQNMVNFEANPQAARGAGLNLTSKLLRLAAVVVP